MNVVSNSDYTCDINIKSSNTVLSSKVIYSHTSTSVVSGVVPAFAPTAGGDSITISGTNFGSTVTVTIDGINCAVTSKTSTSIVCTTGVRVTPPSNGNTFIVVSDGNIAKIACSPFLYVDRWSASSTWGG